jgi:peroxiredoxin family protein
MTKKVKTVSIICFQLCRVYNALVTALGLMREGRKVTMFFGSRGVNAVHKEKVKDLTCLPDQPEKEGQSVMTMMEEMISQRGRSVLHADSRGRYGPCLQPERSAVQLLHRSAIESRMY